MNRTRLCVLIGLLSAPFAGGEAAAQSSGVQVSPDSAQAIVSKDVGAERWAISRASSDGTIIGNVFFADGGEPQFLWCEELDQTESELTVRCLGADRCPLPPCTERAWTEIAEVTIPRSFFELPEGAADAGSAPKAGRGMGSAATRQAGVQVSPDGRSEIVSKDVGSERWAITRDRESGSVTGNVFFPDGREPQFVWCEQRKSGIDLVLGCFGAQRCVAAPCEASWIFLQDVSLPASFFSAPHRVDPGDVVAALQEALGDEAGTIALLLALDRGFSLRQVVRAALAGLLAADGIASNPSSEPEPPASKPGLVFGTEPVNRAVVQQARPTPRGVYEKLVAGGGDQGIAIVLGLVAAGYSVEQISGLFFGVVGIEDCFEEDGCLFGDRVLVDLDDGRIVEPDRPPAALLEDLTGIPREDDPPPWTFRGEAILELTLFAPFAEGFLIQACPAEITFQSDGGIVGIWQCEETFGINCPNEALEEPGGFEIVPRDIVTGLEGQWIPEGAFDLDATVTLDRGAPFEGAFDGSGFFAERAFRNAFEACGMGLSSVVETSIDVARVR